MKIIVFDWCLIDNKKNYMDKEKERPPTVDYYSWKSDRITELITVVHIVNERK